jgi:hypothetical protein
MADDKRRELTPEELEAEHAEELPERAEMSIVNVNAALLVNAGVALNAVSGHATAAANATKDVLTKPPR